MSNTNEVIPRVMRAREVLTRELAALEPGETLAVPYKVCSVRHIRKAICDLDKKGFDFISDLTSNEQALIKRLK
ncbi:MAG: hypothetical protein NC204_01025 [Candidatus Amulumruptor caecigallinarius]|nr:hypothetical protein [Candidatus Amulumruptor caecigallinarius]